MRMTPDATSLFDTEKYIEDTGDKMGNNMSDTAEQEAQIPVQEPQRQYYFMERAKEHLEEMCRTAGRRLTFCVTTFG